MPLPPSATLETVWNELAYPHPYLHGVLTNVMACENAHGNAVVRIGVTGEPQSPGKRKPNYWVMYLSHSGERKPYLAFFENHHPFVNEPKQPPAKEGPNWSTQHLTLAQLQAFSQKVNSYHP
jgi:hypothetical protein